MILWLYRRTQTPKIYVGISDMQKVFSYHRINCFGGDGGVGGKLNQISCTLLKNGAHLKPVYSEPFKNGSLWTGPHSELFFEPFWTRFFAKTCPLDRLLDPRAMKGRWNLRFAIFFQIDIVPAGDTTESREPNHSWESIRHQNFFKSTVHSMLLCEDVCVNIKMHILARDVHLTWILSYVIRVP